MESASTTGPLDVVCSDDSVIAVDALREMVVSSVVLLVLVSGKELILEAEEF